MLRRFCRIVISCISSCLHNKQWLRFGMSVLCLSPQQVAQSLAYILLVCHEIVIYVYINNGSPMIPLKTSVRKIGGNCSIGNRSFFSSRQNQLLPLKQYNYFTGDTLIKLLAVALEIEFWCHLMRFFFKFTLLILQTSSFKQIIQYFICFIIHIWE